MPNQTTILFADDDEGFALLLRYAFEEAQLSARVIHVADGQQVMDYLSGDPPYADRTQYPVPDLLLLDLCMPKMDGFGVLAWLDRRLDADPLPVVVLSTSALDSDRENAMALGADDYRVKPLDFGELLGFARNLEARWLGPRLDATPHPPAGD